MTVGDILLGLLVTTGFFAAAAVSRLFRGHMAGIVIGGVMGIALSVAIMAYGFSDVFDAGAALTQD